MDLALFGKLVEEGALLGIFLIVAVGYVWVLVTAISNGRQDHCVALLLLLAVPLIVWKIHGQAETPYDLYVMAMQKGLRALLGSNGYAGLASLIFFIFSALLLCVSAAFFIGRRVMGGMPAILGLLDASRGRQYDMLRAAVVDADGIIVDGQTVRRGRLEKTEFVCEDGTRYSLEGALLSHDPPRLLLPDGRALRLGRRNPVPRSSMSLTGKLMVPPPLPPRFAQPTVDMKRWEDDLEW